MVRVDLKNKESTQLNSPQPPTPTGMPRKPKAKPKPEPTTTTTTPSTPTDDQLTATILMLTHKRGSTKTICPSEVPRLLFPSAWRACMPRVRAVAIRLAKQGRIDITQKGQVLVVEKEEDIRGPIRLRLREQVECQKVEDEPNKEGRETKAGDSKPALPTTSV